MTFLMHHWKDYLDGLFALFLILNRLDLVMLRRTTNAAIDVLDSLKTFASTVEGKTDDQIKTIAPLEATK